MTNIFMTDKNCEILQQRCLCWKSCNISVSVLKNNVWGHATYLETSIAIICVLVCLILWTVIMPHQTSFPQHQTCDIYNARRTNIHNTRHDLKNVTPEYWKIWRIHNIEKCDAWTLKNVTPPQHHLHKKKKVSQALSHIPISGIQGLFAARGEFWTIRQNYEFGFVSQRWHIYENAVPDIIFSMAINQITK